MPTQALATSTPSAAPALVAAALMLGSALAERLWLPADRHAEQISATVARLDSLPKTINEWTCIELPLDIAQRQAAGVAGGIIRRYSHRTTGAAVTVTLLVGAPGPLAVHPPTACFRGQGYELVAPPQEISILANGAPHLFQSAVFRAPHPSKTETTIAWAWSDGQRRAWSAPAWPRLAFAAAPVLKKLYIAYETRSGEAERPTPFNNPDTQALMERIAAAACDI